MDERRILIDCGEGTQMQLRKYKVKFQRLQYIFISHMHGDHFLGIFGLLTSMNLTGRTTALKVFGPAGLKEIILFLFEKSFVRLAYTLEFVEIGSAEKKLILEDDAIEIFSFPVKHRVPTWGFLFHQKEKKRRIDKLMIEKHKLSIQEMKDLKAGKDIVRGESLIPNKALSLPPVSALRYAYCADTIYHPEICKWIENSDLVYHEATFCEKDRKRAKETMHSTGLDAANIALASGAKKLLIGHFSARYTSSEVILNEARTIFFNTTDVRDGDTFVL